MVDRITYPDKDPGDLFTDEEADALKAVINALGTAADLNAGTAAGNVPVLDATGKLPLAVIPEGLTGGAGTGNVTGPGASTDGRVALWDGTTGLVLKQGTAEQLVPSGSNLQFLQMVGTTPTFVASSAIVTALEALTTTDRLEYTGINGLDSSGAGALTAKGIVAAVGADAGDLLAVNGTTDGFVELDVEPANPVPTAASSSSGAITLNFDASDTITTTTTENITAITISNLDLYEAGAWRITFGGAHTVTFPTGSRAPQNPYTGTSGKVTWIRVWRSGASAYDFTISDGLATI